jgi:protein-export membrane protein SecD
MKRTRVVVALAAFIVVALGALYFVRSRSTRASHGVRLVYTIDLERVIDDETQDLAYRIGTILDEAGISAAPSADAAPGTFVVHIPDPSKAEKLRGLIAEFYREELVVRPCAVPDASKVCAQLAPSRAAAVRRDALKETVAILRVRLDNAGIAASVSEQGGQLVVELPGVDDDTAGSVRALLGRNASLEFRLVAHDTSVARALHRHVGPVDAPRDPEAQRLGIKAYTDSWRARPHAPGRRRTTSSPPTIARRRAARCSNATSRPPPRPTRASSSATTTSSATSTSSRGLTPRIRSRTGAPTVSSARCGIDSRAVADVEVRHDPTFGRPEVFVVFTSHGRQVFAELTAASIGRKLAIVLDGRVVTAPIIQGEMRIGRVTISVGGNSTKEQEADAVALRDVLRAGMLPAPLREESVSRWGSP